MIKVNKVCFLCRKTYFDVWRYQKRPYLCIVIKKEDALGEGQERSKQKKKKVKKIVKMKKMMILASALIMGVAANAEMTNMQPFSGVSVNVPARVRLVYGEEYGMNVQAADSLVASGIRWSVKDGVLSIRTIDESEKLENVRITIVSPVVPKVSVGRNMEMRTAKRNADLARKD